MGTIQDAFRVLYINDQLWGIVVECNPGCMCGNPEGDFYYSIGHLITQPQNFTINTLFSYYLLIY